MVTLKYLLLVPTYLLLILKNRVPLTSVGYVLESVLSARKDGTPLDDLRSSLNYALITMKDPLAPIPLSNGCVMGFFYEINGDGAREHQARVTRFEMELLCKHWAKQLLAVSEEWVYFGSTGSWEMRVMPYARTRLGYFQRFLGDEKVTEIVDEVFKDFDPDAPCVFDVLDDGGADQSPDEVPAESLN
jgi:hypothetical protein